MSLLSLIGICRHRRLTFPQGAAGRCYVVCLDCTRRFRYDWLLMKRGAELEPGARLAEPQTEARIGFIPKKGEL